MDWVDAQERGYCNSNSLSLTLVAHGEPRTRMPMLVTNVEGYSVGVQHLLGTDVYAFGLTDGENNWSGFEDLEGFGRATLTPGNRYKWGEVSLSQYNE